MTPDTKSPDIPQTVEALMRDVPDEAKETIERDAKRLLQLPLKIDKDVAKLLVLASRKPGEVTDIVYNLPGDIPDNVDRFLETLREGIEYGDMDEEMRGERLRRITDVIDLFTPT